MSELRLRECDIHGVFHVNAECPDVPKPKSRLRDESVFDSRCTNPPSETCSDSGCPVHGYYDNPFDGVEVRNVTQAPAAAAPVVTA